MSFFKIFSNFVHFCLNLEIFCPFFALFLPYFKMLLSFFWNIACMALLSRIDTGAQIVDKKWGNTLEVNMITKQMNPFFFIYSLNSICLVFFIFVFQDFQNATSGVPHFLYVLVFKIYIYLKFIFYFQFDTFSSDSGPGLTRQQFKKKFLFSKKVKLTQKNCHWKVKIL